MLDDLTAACAVCFLRRAVAWFAERGVHVRAVMSDNGGCHSAHDYAAALRQLGLRHHRIRPLGEQPGRPILSAAVRVVGYGSRYFARCRIDAVSIRPSVSAQRDATQKVLAQSPPERWEFNFVRDPLVRYLRDRRLEIALSLLSREGLGPRDFGSSLVVCGGVGGEGVFLLRRGFENVTLSDIAPAALDACPEPRLARRVLNAEEMRDLADGSFDLVVVQDGLHHLPRPTLGFTEMLRVARRAVIVIEPHASLVGKIIGTTWERHGDALNYVFRWNGKLFTDLTRSYLGQRCATTVARVWDHNVSVNRVASKLPRPLRLPVAKAIYAALTPFNSVGNMMIGVALKS